MKSENMMILETRELLESLQGKQESTPLQTILCTRRTLYYPNSIRSTSNRNQDTPYTWGEIIN
jgi:hypothetical protein